ncbi:MAG: SDR family oxidoreductase [Azonexus sp.]|jgi:NAD(P)-dependent dehydrogenase (short-subunit alcohol dehydrogenase family)|nr:SDR family oxidoreductase [Azonexus sp.]
MNDPMGVFCPDFLVGKTALVAGGTSGVGFGIAKALFSYGANVAVCGRDAAKAEAAAHSLGVIDGRALGLSADVRQPEMIAAAVAQCVGRFGPLDIVVAAAAGNFVVAAEKMSPKAFKTVIDIDLLGCFNVFHAVFTHLRCPGASLLAISSGHATRPVAGQIHASAAKSGINMLVKGLAVEWGPAGIRTNALVPGPVAGTEGMARLLPTDQLAGYVSSLPLRRLADVNEIASAALFLASPAASYINGAILECDGGSRL